MTLSNIHHYASQGDLAGIVQELANGVPIGAIAPYNSKAIHKARSLAMVDCLVAAGEDWAEMDRNLRPLVTQIQPLGVCDLPVEEYQRDRTPRYGTANPDAIAAPFWQQMVQCRWTAANARAHYEDTDRTIEPLQSGVINGLANHSPAYPMGGWWKLPENTKTFTIPTFTSTTI